MRCISCVAHTKRLAGCLSGPWHSRARLQRPLISMTVTNNLRQNGYGRVTNPLPTHYQPITNPNTNPLPTHYQPIPSPLPNPIPTHYPPITNPLPTQYQPITNPLPTHYQPITNPLPAHYQPITNPLPTHYQPISNPLPTHYPLHVASCGPSAAPLPS